ncbi:MAG: FHA domain-containing protein [Phycisphaerales bacterium]
MEANLVMVKPDGTSKEIPIDRDVFIVGRDDGARLRIPLPSVSRRHCEIVKDDGELLVTDKGSSNGTYVNGKRVKETELAPGDLLCIGPIVFVVRIDGHPRQIDAKDSFAAGSVTEDSDGSSVAPAHHHSGGSRAASHGPATAGPSTSSTGKPKNAGDGEDDDKPLSELLKDFDFGDDEDDEPKKK